MPREGQIARLLRIVQLMATRGYGVTVGEMAYEEDCSPRTIYRDLVALQEAGFPIYSEKEDQKTIWRFVDGYKHYIPIPFEINELVALYYGRGMFEVLKGTAFYDSLESLAKKIRSSLAPETVRLIDQFDDVLAFGQRAAKDYGRFREIVNQVNRACSEQRQIEMVYYTLSRDTETQRRLDPYKIWYFEGTLYLIGFCHMRNEVRMFALDRIRLVEVKDVKFKIPEGFSIEKYMANCFGLIHDEVVHVKVQFTGDAARWVADRKWHPSQEIQTNTDGSITASYRVGGTSEIKKWILGFGPMAEVQEPKDLYVEIVSDASEMLENYEKKEMRTSKKKKRSRS